MAVITSGKTFANGEQLSASKLNQVITAATFNEADAVDGSTMTLVGGAMAVRDGGITKGKLSADALELAYPVGSIYMNAAVATNPGTLLGFGTWVAFGAGKVPVGIDSSDTDFDAAEETGGAKTHTLTTSEIPSHTHTYSESSNGPAAQGVGGGYNPATAVGRQEANSGSTGGGQTHNNLQPYIVVYMWKRTA